MRIVLVDDDKIIRMGLKKLIERLFSHHEVVADYQNGSLAYDYLRENEGNIDLVITDIKMPLMTGVELIKKSIEELKTPPMFVVLSGYDEFTYVRDTMKYGACNYLLKPIKNEELKNVIEEAENETNKTKQKNKFLNRSIEILKKEFFKKILFSQKNIEDDDMNKFLENVQLEENYKYKLIVVDNCDSKIYLQFINSISSERQGINNVIFSYKEKIYILLYIQEKEVNIAEEINNIVLSNINIFTENHINAYLFELTDEVYEIREQSSIIRRMDKDTFNDKSGRVYFLNNSKIINEILIDQKEETNHSTVIRLAKDYIINNYNKNITLKDVADEVYLSQNYLSELFKKEVGEGFYDFLSKYRIKKAKEMLITTNIKIYEVANRVGYNDSITFGRAFKKITGTTPNCFRNNMEG